MFENIISKIKNNKYGNIKILENSLLEQYRKIPFENSSVEDRIEEYKNICSKYSKMYDKYITYICKHREPDTYIPLPPFIVFPAYSPMTLGWRMGEGEKYEYCWLQKIEALSDEQLSTCCNQYDYPAWWLNFKMPKNCSPRYHNYPWSNI